MEEAPFGCSGGRDTRVIVNTPLGLLAMDLSSLGRGTITVLIAALLVSALLLVTFGLDRPTRGLITVPDTPLTKVRASMVLPPAAIGPSGP